MLLNIFDTVVKQWREREKDRVIKLFNSIQRIVPVHGKGTGDRKTLGAGTQDKKKKLMVMVCKTEISSLSVVM